jgi:hypothetical protein
MSVIKEMVRFLDAIRMAKFVQFVFVHSVGTVYFVDIGMLVLVLF